MHIFGFGFKICLYRQLPDLPILSIFGISVIVELIDALQIPHQHNELPNACLDISKFPLSYSIKLLLRHLIGLKSLVQFFFEFSEADAVQDCLGDIWCLNQLVLANVELNLVETDVKSYSLESEVDQLEVAAKWKKSCLSPFCKLMEIEVIDVLEEVHDELWILVGDVATSTRRAFSVLHNCARQQVLTFDHQWCQRIENGKLVEKIIES